MKVFTAMQNVDYEGSDLLGVFGSKEEAEACCRKEKCFGKVSYSYGVVESELGQDIDFFVMVRWLE